MSEPVRVQETRSKGYETVTKEWTYDELLELFCVEGACEDGNVVAPLVRRCQSYEQEIADLKAKLESRQAATSWEADHQRKHLEALGLAEEFPFGCDAIQHVGEALLAARAQRTQASAEIGSMDLLEEIEAIALEEVRPYIQTRSDAIVLATQGDCWDDPEQWQLEAVELAHGVYRLLRDNL